MYTEAVCRYAVYTDDEIRVNTWMLTNLENWGAMYLDESGEPVKITQYSRWLGDGETIDVYAATQEEVDQVMALYNAITTTYNYDQRIYDIIKDMAGAYFAGDRGLDDTATQIQSRVKLYMNEQL